MKLVAQRAKRIVKRVPGGNKILIPAVIRIMQLKAAIHDSLVSPTRHKRIREEVESLSSAPQVGSNSAVCIIYDNSVSPTVYGDFLYSVLIARWLSVRGRRVIFYVTDSNFRSDLSANLHPNSLQQRVDDQIALAHALIPQDHCHISKIRSESVKEMANQALEGGAHVFFKDQIERGKPFYQYCFDTLTLLVPRLSNSELQSFLLPNAPQFGRPMPFGLDRYISISVRHNKSWGSERNTPDEILVQTIRLIRKSLPSFQVLIVSDEKTCEYFKRAVYMHGLDCFFSSDLGNGVLDDLAFLMNSSLSVQIPASGLAVPLLYSNVPFLIFGIPIHEKSIIKLGRLPWFKDNQRWVITNHFPNDSVGIEDFLLTKFLNEPS